MKHRLHWLKYRMHWTAEKISIIGDAFGLPLQERNSSQMAAVSANSMSGVSTAIYDTIQSLPNLRHVEHAISSQESRVFRNLEFDFFNKTRIRNLRDFLADPSMHLSFGEGLILVLENLNPTITSLKLRSFPVCADCYNGKILPATLQHLDLEIQEPNSSRVPDPSRQTFTDGWRSTLESLKQLRALRLALDTFCERPLHSFYVDDVLINREDSTKNSFFPHLTRLSLTGCSLRMGSLISFATSHSSTLKDLELNRITFDPSYRPGSWSEIGALCKSVLPGLVRLRLARLVIQGPRRWVDPAQIPARWSQGLEDATAYEWEKGVHGPDTESIGSRCPWEPGKLTL